MSTRKAVIDASPFILLCKCDLIELLPKLFEEISMPKSVSLEIIQGRDMASERLYEFEETWLQRCLVPNKQEVLSWNLGEGETEVLSMAYANKEVLTALMDDRAARRCAETLGISTLGTGGLLILAKRNGLIQSVKSELERLETAGLYL